MFPIILAATAATSVPAQLAPDIATVQRIEIRSTWGGLGGERYFNAVIERRNGQLSDDGVLPPARAVLDVLAALSKSAVAAPDPANFGFSNTVNPNDYLHKCVGDAADFPAVNTHFAKLYFAPVNQQQWLSDYYSEPIRHTDDYPTERVEVTFADGSKMSAESNSQSEYMLPFTRTVNGQTSKTYDPALSRALARLSPANVNYDRLEGHRFYEAYAAGLCDRFRKSLNALVIATAIPVVSDYVRRYGLKIGRIDLALSPDLARLSGEVHFPDWPTGLTFGIQADGAPLNTSVTQAAGLRALVSARADGLRIAKLSWLATWLQSSDEGALFLMPFMGGPAYFSQEEILDGLRRHSPRIYDSVLSNETATLYGMLWDKNSKMASSWLFLPDGRSVLVGFNATESTLGPLSKKNVVTWSAFARNEADESYPWRATVTVLDPAGQIVQP